MTNLKYLAAVLGLALTACGGPAVYNKPGATQDEFAQTKWSCISASRGTSMYRNDPTLSGQTASAIVEEMNFRACMADHGYALQ